MTEPTIKKEKNSLVWVDPEEFNELLDACETFLPSSQTGLFTFNQFEFVRFKTAVEVFRPPEVDNINNVIALPEKV